MRFVGFSGGRYRSRLRRSWSDCMPASHLRGGFTFTSYQAGLPGKAQVYRRLEQRTLLSHLRRQLHLSLRLHKMPPKKPQQNNAPKNKVAVDKVSGLPSVPELCRQLTTSHPCLLVQTFGLANKGGKKAKQVAQQQQLSWQQTGKNPDALAKEKEKELKAKLKEAELKRKKEEAALFQTVIVQPKVPFGVDPKTIMCAFFKAGICEKGK